MRIKIIGDNNCARATRHLLRLAGFAVTEYLPVDAVTHAPHSGYAISIDLAPAVYTPVSSLKPDQAPHGQPAAASEEAPRFNRDASSPPFAEATAGRPAFPQATEGRAASDGAALHRIHFDSVDSALETAVLRHVTQLATVPVVVDRPGGVVHSDRELRIIVPASGDAKMDEAAAVAVEFGVLRGLLDLIAPRGKSNVLGLAAGTDSGSQDATWDAEGKSAEGVAFSGGASGSKKKWWTFGVLLIAHAALLFAGGAQASPRRAAKELPHVVELRGVNGAYLHLNASLAAAEPQGQFATGQGVKIFDGTNTLVVDPCKAQVKSYASINQTANTQLVTGTASKKIYICSIHVVVAIAANVALVEGTGTVCGTGTAGVNGFGGATAATGWNFAANSGIVLGNGDAAVGAEGTSADNLCLFNSGSGQVSGGISYVVE